jgi:2,4-dienoyl-CoA reductase-like NADH-dependent reductase (Old Yellow Enzyme family)
MNINNGQQSQTDTLEGLANGVSNLSTDKLFEGVRVGGIRLKNRVVMSPMTRTMSPGGVPGTENAAYYARRAKGGVGLIITEGTWVPHDAASNAEDVPRMYGSEALAGWAQVVREVHDADAHIFSQLWHIGQMKQPILDGLSVGQEGEHASPRRIGPSGIFGGVGFPLATEGEPATQADLDSIVEAFGKAAAAAQRLGFDGVELHAAHGYVFDQFFWETTNRRDDHYAGSVQNRARLAAQAVAEIRRVTGPDFPISLRISQWKVQDYDAKICRTPGELEEFVGPLVDAGVDVFHCSQRRFWEGEFGTDLNLAAWTKKVSGKPSISVGSVAMKTDLINSIFHGASSQVDGIERLLKMMDRGDFDLIAVGRGLLADPEWPAKVRLGALDKLIGYTPELLNALV